MTRSRSTRRHTGTILLTGSLVIVVFGAAVIGGAMALRPTANMAVWKKAVRHIPDPLTNNELAVALTRLGLWVEPLAAAGCTGTEAATLVGNARTYLNDHIQDLRDADTNWGVKRDARDNLQRLVQGGKRENFDALTAAQSDFTSADSTRNTLLANIFSAAVDGLDAGKLAVLQTLRGNAMWDVPIQYRAGNRSESNWVELRDSLANDRISTAQGVDPDAVEHQFLLDAQAETGVNTAATNLAGLGDLTTAWNAAVFPG